MKTANKIIMSGLAAFLISCSEVSTTPDITGATTEPSSSPKTSLTEEQKAILARSFYSLVDSSKGVLDTSNLEYDLYPDDVSVDSRFSYPSKDKRRTCEVVTYADKKYRDEFQAGVILSMSYEPVQFFSPYFTEHPDDYTIAESTTLIASQLIDVDGYSVVMKTVATGMLYDGYWGYNVTCSEYLDKFKRSCNESNGLFRDFGDGCRFNQLRLACALFTPDGKSTEDLLNTYAESYKSVCKEDSLKYAPYDDEKNAYQQSPEVDDSLEQWSLFEVWNDTLTHKFNKYYWQFVRSEDLLNDEPGPSAKSGLAIGYNTLLEGDVANAYREEGVYLFPDSLVSTFFPLTSSIPVGLGYAKKTQNVFYLLVVKDVGEKGHLLKDINEDGLFVTNIVKDGTSCLEDSTVHYAAYLITGSPEWGILDKPIVKDTYVSKVWNCDNPESLEKIEPYGEWTSYWYNGWK